MKLKPIDWKSWFRSFLIAALLVWIISATIISPKVVSLSSMEPSLFPGDLVLVSKWQIGARTPISFGIPFTKFQLSNFSIPPNRLPGTGDIEKGDIILFNYPLDSAVIDRKKLNVKRIIGLPSDTIAIRDLALFINGVLFEESYPVLVNYEIPCSQDEFKKVMQLVDYDELKITHTKENLHIVGLTQSELETINKHFPEIKITAAKLSSASFINKQLPTKDNKSWTTDNLGPLYIPKKGDSIVLNAENLLLYNRIIEKFELAKIETKGDSIWIDGEYQSYFTFTQDYFFVIGDNRHNSIDSRHWGLLPKNHIIGKINMVLFSFDPNAKLLHRIRWSKMLHTPK